MNIKNSLFVVILLALSLTLSACSSDEKGNEKQDMNQMNHKGMNHSGSGEVPKELKEAINPKYEVGSQAIIKASHMEGMKGAKAKIIGAYDTTAYVVSYTPTTGGKRVENHKWVIQEEIRDAGNKTLKAGTEVKLNANHMKGMKGATADIVSSEKTTVYMVDYTTTTGGEKVTNHKWVTEGELQP
ncbi:YdhK family protein [Fictibacillus sp. KIGAM418]|uniref:YdhK family protein n=1 Tax=Fictibacillus marinisediminis TaxID=2878389 RepID=A0A9X2BFA7_9BACL|nr:YdhK family protein [Fictibacillus marinisediminis]MCK6259541.1 YdhK family protein [Fictibacillus marinisediminis]